MIMRLSNMRAGFTLAEGATHVAHCENSRKQGFTLAEVLITLGIIGVVAAMTMPTLMNKTNGAQYKAAYKKGLSAISQAITLNVALDGASFADIDTAGDAGDIAQKSGKDTVASVLNSRMNIVNHTSSAYTGFPSSITIAETCEKNSENKEVCTPSTSLAPDTFLFFNDGITFAYKAAKAVTCTDDKLVTTNGEINHCVGAIDVNGQKGPNKVVTCDSKKLKDDSCTVTNPTDIYPVFFYDQTVVPATDAAKAVLYSK